MNSSHYLGTSLSLLFAAMSTAFAGQHIIIDSTLPSGQAIYGNGIGPYGEEPTQIELLQHVEGNSVTLTNNSQTGGDGGVVVGGYAISAFGSSMSHGNSVFIDGGIHKGGIHDGPGDIYGGHAESSSGFTNAIAAENTVIMRAGEVSGIVGGYAHHVASGVATAADNHILINGGTVTKHVIGGYASTATGYSAATNNIVTISGNPNLKAAPLLGGLTYGGFAGDEFTGNTLNVWNYNGSSIAEIRNFQYFDFRIPVTQTGPVIEAAHVDLGATNGSGKGSTVTSINTGGGSPPMPVGSTVTLIQSENLHPVGFSQTYAQGQHSALLSYLWKLDATATELRATVANVEVNPQAKALSEGFLMGVGLVNQTGDFVTGRGIRLASEAADKGYRAFGGVSGSKLRYKTGSNADMDSVSLMAGVSRDAKFNPGRLTLAAFLEYGNGSYDTHNAFPNAAPVYGKGNVDHAGGGILSRFDMNAGSYVEGSFRAGRVNNEYRNEDLRDGAGRTAKVDSSSGYYSLHVGTGHVRKLAEKASLDLYGKFFWTRQQGDSVTLFADDPVEFKSVNSKRLRVGSRLVHTANAYVSPYVGAAYEHEFDGRARATTYGYSLDTPSLRGSTGIGELGLSIRPSNTRPLFLDLGVQGYMGKREGVTGSLQARFEF